MEHVPSSRTFFTLIMSRAPHMRVVIYKQKNISSASPDSTFFIFFSDIFCVLRQRQNLFFFSSSFLTD
jgi:hypothetical protein